MWKRIIRLFIKEPKPVVKISWFFNEYGLVNVSETRIPAVGEFIYCPEISHRVYVVISVKNRATASLMSLGYVDNVRISEIEVILDPVKN